MLFPYRNIVILTGAGISAESGIRTFRDQDGLWENHHIEDVATPEGYRRDPSLVQNFYNQRRQQLESGTVSPNAAHLALSKLEAELDGTVTIVTQNIDNLHEMAGSENVIHMHGELLKAQCSGTGQSIQWQGDIKLDDHCHCCQIPLVLQPAMHGAHTIELNLEPSEVQSEFAEKRYGPASIVVPEFIDEILSTK